MLSYPLTASGFTVIQIWFFFQHLGLLTAIAALARAETMVPGRNARWGTGLAASGTALLAITELIAITARNSTRPGDGDGLLDALYGVSSLAVGVGLILAGIAVRRTLDRMARTRGAGRRHLRVRSDDTCSDGPVRSRAPRDHGRMLLFAVIGYALWKAESR